MVMKESTMLSLGTEAPDFSLPDTEGNTVSLGDVAGKNGVLVMFICNHCPFVIHVREELARLATDYADKGIGFVAISSNSVETHPQDGPEKMKEEKAAAGYSFPYLYDESQDVAKAYRAACTPDFFLFDGEKKLAYRGQLDSTRPNSGAQATGEDMRAALNAVLAGHPVPEPHRPSAGCNIKWTPGNEPDYF